MVAGDCGLDHARAAGFGAGRYGEQRMTRMLTNHVEGDGPRNRFMHGTTARRMSRDGVTNDASKFLFVH